MLVFCPKKLNFSAPGGQTSAIFDTEDLDLLYFEVGNVLAPPNPPYMSKNAHICATFSTFWESHEKHTPKEGVYRENFNIGNLALLVFFTIFWKMKSDFLKEKNTRLYKDYHSQMLLNDCVFFLAIFHTPWIPVVVWKIAKLFKNCTWRSVVIFVWFFPLNLVFDKSAKKIILRLWVAQNVFLIFLRNE